MIAGNLTDHMRKSWPFVVAVIVVGGLAGVAIAGRPTPSDTFVLDPNATSVTSTTSTPPTSTAEPRPTVPKPTTTPPTTAAVSTTSAAPSTTAPATTASTTAPTTAAPTTTALPTTTTVPGPLPRNQVRLVLANGDGRFKLASTTADRMRPLGYVIALGDSLKPSDATLVYYRPGFADEAAVVAKDLGVPKAIVAAFPANAAQPITDADAKGDVIVVLGPDAPR